MRAWWQRLTPWQQLGRVTALAMLAISLPLAALLPLLGGPWR